MTGSEVAQMLGVSRRTLYRWHHEGRLYVWEWESDKARTLQKRPRGPKKNPHSKRYTLGRHSFQKHRA